MLTNTKEYQDLKNKVASFLGIESKLIYSIANPMRRKKLPYLMVGIEGIKSILLKVEDDSFKRI